MINVLGKIPNNPIVAISGGIDSMVLLDFLIQGRHNPKAIYYNHGTEFGHRSEKFLADRCKELGIELIIDYLEPNFALKNSDGGLENYWRNKRYEVFNSFPGTILTAHHLNDVAEWWIFSSMHGEGKLIPYKNKNVIRPFLMVEKEKIKNWADRKNVKYIDDPSNFEIKFKRNLIRHEIMPHALKVNPGLLTVLKKKLHTVYK
jgi:tRNA(Ile)-lysidine synthase